MRLKITLSLLAILMGLLAYILYVDTSDEVDPFESEKKSVLGELAVGIDYLKIRDATSGKDITFELRDKQWFLTSPYNWPANEFAVQKILTQLRFLERITSFETKIASTAGVSLKDYGLAPPELSIVFGREGQRYTLGIGKVTDIGNNLYILSTDQQKIHVVDRSLLDSLSLDLAELRSPRLFDTAVFEVTAWNIQVRDEVRNLRAWFARVGENWIFETPIRARADTAAVNTLLNRCLNLEANEIVASNPSDLSVYDLQNAPYRIAIESEEGREVLEIGKLISEDSDFRYAKRESRAAVFQLNIDFLDLLENAQTKLRQRRIFELDITEATTVTIDDGDDSPVTLQQLEGGSWEIVTRDESQGIQTQKGDAETIAEMLNWLDQLKAVPDTGFVNDAPSAPDLESYGLEVPEFTIAISSDKLHGNDEELETPASTTLLIGDRAPNNRHESFVKIASKDFVYSVYNDVFERITSSPNRYKDREIVRLAEGSRISSIQITRISDGQSVASFDFSDESEPGENALALAQSLSNLRAESFNPEGFTSTVEIAGRLQPWAYALEVEIRQNGSEAASAESFTLYISETSGGPLLMGGLPDKDIGFRFGMGFIDAFTAIVFDRPAPKRPEAPFSATPLPANQDADDESTAAPSPEANQATGDN